ncbi:MAG: hypothetical protein P8Y03_28445 [Anaerolineales bacterium]
MNSNSSGTSLVIGLAAVGLGVVIAGVRLYRRRRAEGAGGLPEEEIEVEEDRGEEGQSVAEDLADDGEAHESMGANVPQEDGSLIAYFTLVFVLAAPFWLVGDRKLPTAINLPASALATFVPVTAAAILSYRKDGFNGVKQLLKKAFDYRKIKSKTWLLPALLLALYRRRRRRVGLVGICHRPDAKSMGSPKGQHSFRRRVGCLARHPICANWKSNQLGSLAILQDGGHANCDRVDLQQRRKKCAGCHPISHQRQYQLVLISE